MSKLANEGVVVVDEAIVFKNEYPLSLNFLIVGINVLPSSYTKSAPKQSMIMNNMFFCFFVLINR